MQGSTTALFMVLKDAHSHCAITGREWLPLDVLDQHITDKSVQACTTLGNSLCGRYDAEDIVKRSKKAFAILVLSNCQDILEDLLLREGLTDDQLPLEQRTTDGVLVNMKSGKEFPAFSKVGPLAIDLFLERQWRVLAPVFDEAENCCDGSSTLRLNTKCPLPLRQKTPLTSTNTSSVSKCELHPSHYRSNKQQVSCQ